MRVVARRTVLAAFAALVVLAPASPAAAHASLESSTPTANSVLERGPDSIVLRFDEGIEPSLSTIELFAADGTAVDIGEPTPGDGDAVVVAAVDGSALADGVYAVRWEVTSLDGHVVDGTFAFQVGTAAGGDADELLASIGAADDDSLVSWLALIARVASLLGLVVGVGGGWWALQRNAALLAERRTRILVTGGLVLLLVGSALALGAFVARTGRGFTTAVEVSTGRMLLVRVVAAVLLLALAATARRSERRTEDWWRLAVTLVTAAVVLGFSAAGHPGAASPRWLWVALDAVHLVGVTLWLGGLVVVVVQTRAVLDTVDTEFVVRRFSAVSTVAVPLVVATGVAQTMRLAGGLDDVTATEWGRLLLVKVVLVVVALAVAGATRWLLVHEGTSSLRRTMALEAVVGVVIIGLVGVLMGEAPRPPVEQRPFAATLTVDGVIAEVSVLPGVVGVNELHIVVTPPGGSLVPIADLSARVVPVGSTGPTSPATLTREGPDHFSGSVTFTSSGDWTIELIVSIDDASSSIVRTVVTVP